MQFDKVVAKIEECNFFASQCRLCSNSTNLPRPKY